MHRDRRGWCIEESKKKRIVFPAAYGSCDLKNWSDENDIFRCNFGYRFSKGEKPATICKHTTKEDIVGGGACTEYSCFVWYNYYNDEPVLSRLTLFSSGR